MGRVVAGAPCMLAPLLAALTLASSPLVSSPPIPRLAAAQAEEDGARAPANTWTARHGNAARTGGTHTRPLRRSPETAWELELPGEIESEPLVWGPRALLSCRVEDDERMLLWIDLERGRIVDRSRVESTTPLEPSLWRDRIVIRSGNDELQTYWTRGDELRQARRKSLSVRALGAPLLLEDAIYVRAEGELVRLDPAQLTEDWRAGKRLRGEVAVRGDLVRVLAYDIQGNASLESYDRRSGERRGSTFAGNCQRTTPLVHRGPSLQLLDDSVLVVHEGPIGPDTDFGPLRSVFFPDRASSLERSDSVQPIAISMPVTVMGAGWFAYAGEPVAGILQVEFEDDGEIGVDVLAAEGLHDHLLEAPVPPTRARDVVYAGATAIDVETRDILWRLDLQPRFRAVPIERGVLYVTGDRTLRLVREPQLAAARGPLLVRPDEEGLLSAEDARALTRSGASLDADAVFDADTGQVTFGTGRRARELGLQELSLVVDEEGAPLYLSLDATAVADAVERLARTTEAEAVAKLAYRARTAQDPVLLAELVARARALGAEGSNLEKAEKELEKLEQKSRPPKPRAKRVEDTRASLASIEAEREGALRRLLDGLPEDLPQRLRLALLRELLERHPDSEGVSEVYRLAETALPGDGSAREFLAGLLGRDREDEAVGPALSWLSYLQASALHPVDFRLPPREDRPGLTLAQRQFGVATTRWREDLVVAETDQLWIMTPLTEPGALAQSILVGELVGKALDDLFAGEELVERETQPMGMRLYESQKEYLAKSTDDPLARLFLRATAGHYVPGENLQHIFLPPGERGVESVLSVYAHELVHNWTDMRCRLFSAEDQVRSTKTAGYWIVEGFADFVGEFRWDLERGTYADWNPRAHYLDQLANTPALLDWDDLFRWNQRQAQSLSTRPEYPTLVTWNLSRGYELSDMSLLYVQSAAACFWLWHAEGGKHRGLLADVVRAYYTGEGETHLPTLLGRDPDELGRDILAFARGAIRTVD